MGAKANKRGCAVYLACGACAQDAQQPARAARTAATISSMVTLPSPLRSPGRHASMGVKPRATATRRTSSSTVTSPEPSQSPTHAEAGVAEGVAVDVGVAAGGVNVALGLAGAVVPVGDGCGDDVAVAVGTGFCVDVGEGTAHVIGRMKKRV